MFYEITLDYILMLIAVHVDFDWVFFYFLKLLLSIKALVSFYCHIMFWSKSLLTFQSQRFGCCLELLILRLLNTNYILTYKVESV